MLLKSVFIFTEMCWRKKWEVALINISSNAHMLFKCRLIIRETRMRGVRTNGKISPLDIVFIINCNAPMDVRKAKVNLRRPIFIRDVEPCLVLCGASFMNTVSDSHVPSEKHT